MPSKRKNQPNSNHHFHKKRRVWPRSDETHCSNTIGGEFAPTGGQKFSIRINESKVVCRYVCVSVSCDSLATSTCFFFFFSTTTTLTAGSHTGCFDDHHLNCFSSRKPFFFFGIVSRFEFFFEAPPLLKYNYISVPMVHRLPLFCESTTMFSEHFRV